MVPSHFPWESWLNKQLEHIKPIEDKKGKYEKYKKNHKVIDADGEGEQLDEIELPLRIAKRVDDLPELKILEKYAKPDNPDLWSENDEFCLKKYGYMDYYEMTQEESPKKRKYFFDTFEDIS